MNTITTVSRQWASRPDDERFCSLNDLLAHYATQRRQSREVTVQTRQLEVRPAGDMISDIEVYGPNGHGYEPTHWGFGQLATLAGAPAGYLRTLPAPIAADAINYGLRFRPQRDDVGVLLTRNGSNLLRAITGPTYGRVWNEEIARTLVHRFGDGVTGDWRVPGEFGQRVTVTKENTTIYGSDRDLFVFLADEDHRIEVPNRRHGQPGTMARGFYVWNSDVGARTLGIAAFLFDYVCCNRIIWGVEDFRQVTVRHTATAPDRWLDEVQPVLEAYAHGATRPIIDRIAAAQARKIDDLQDFLAKRFTAKLAAQAMAAHKAEEGRPAESLWDAVTAVTAVARSYQHQDSRVALERQAGDLLKAA